MRVVGTGLAGRQRRPGGHRYEPFAGRREDGRALDPQYVSREFQKIRLQGEPLPELTFHGLRHSAASLMLAGGADISTVSKLLGHSSIAITADVYAHLIASVGQRAVDGAAALIPRKAALAVHTQPSVQADAG
ncbi:MAG TPA: site-specific integrase [Propionibacteriaceae bacterium]|nr:site-specific integrase [Propionibacteriaceae bacterium]